MDRSEYTPVALAYLCKVMHKTFTGHNNILRNLEQIVAIWKDCLSSKKKKCYRTLSERVLSVMSEMGGGGICTEDVKLFIGAPNGGWGDCRPAAPPPTNRNFKNSFCSHDAIKGCT